MKDLIKKLLLYYELEELGENVKQEIYSTKQDILEILDSENNYKTS